MFSLRQAADCLARTHLPDPIGLVLLKSFPQGEEYSVVISSAISGLPHPPLWFKNSSGSNRLLRFGQNKKKKKGKISPCHGDQWSTDPNVSVSLPSKCHRPRIITELRNTEGWCASTLWCQEQDVISCNLNQMVEEIYWRCGSAQDGCVIILQ